MSITTSTPTMLFSRVTISPFPDMLTLPPGSDEEFVARMEEILEVYHRPFDPRFPVVAMDEQPIQLLQHTRQCLTVRMNDMENVRPAIAAWTDYRNTHAKDVDWQFTTDDARQKLKSIYPVYQFETNSSQIRST